MNQNLQYVASVLNDAAEHLRQYRQYAEAMRAHGKGFEPSGPWSPDYMAGLVATAQAKLQAIIEG